MRTQMTAPKELSVVLPCFNEEEAIPTLMPRLLQSLEALRAQGHLNKYEVIVVNDNSTDRSEDLLRKLEGIQLLQNPGARGYGQALKVGFAAAQMDWIAFLDVDNTYRPEDIHLLLSATNDSGHDFIMGARSYDQTGMSLVRGFGNWFFKSLAQAIYRSPLSDVCSGFRLFHRRHVEQALNIPESGLDFSIHFTLKMLLQDVPIKQIPIGYDDRLGQSKLSVVKDGLAFLKVLLVLRLRQGHALKHSRVR